MQEDEGSEAVVLGRAALMVAVFGYLATERRFLPDDTSISFMDMKRMLQSLASDNESNQARIRALCGHRARLLAGALLRCFALPPLLPVELDAFASLAGHTQVS